MPDRKSKGRRLGDITNEEANTKMKILKENHLTLTIGGFISVILALFWITYYVSTYKSDIEHNFKIIDKSVTQLVITCSNQKIDTDKLKMESISLKVKLAVIETKLSNIEILLIDIKDRIK